MLGFPHGGSVRTDFMLSVVAEAQDPSSPVDYVYAHGSGPGLSKARNAIAARFLETDYDYLWMVDTDIVFSPATLPALLQCADPVDRPLVSAVYHSQWGDLPLFPVLFRAARNSGTGRFGFVPLTDGELPDKNLAAVAAAGCGCLLAHRSVFERISKAKPEEAALWFAEMIIDGDVFGEDLSFCVRAALAEVPVLTHSGIQVGHVKPQMLGTVTP
jgi:GT2 family glycosyltransferase